MPLFYNLQLTEYVRVNRVCIRKLTSGNFCTYEVSSSWKVPRVGPRAPPFCLSVAELKFHASGSSIPHWAAFFLIVHDCISEMRSKKLDKLSTSTLIPVILLLSLLYRLQ